MSPERLPDFQQQQLAFTAHIRDPDNTPGPDGIPGERMSVYTELFFNGLDSHLSGNFPVMRQILSDDKWAALVRDFFIRHRCTTPLFTRIGLEFIDYLRHERQAAADDPPFMSELAHYEYAELAVSLNDDVPPEHDPNGDLLQGRPVLSPAAWILSYRYPVHRIAPDYLPDTPAEEATHLVVYRDRQDEVHFLEINPVTQRLLQLLKENPLASGLELLKQIAADLTPMPAETVIDNGTRLLLELHERNVILGSN